MEYQPKKKGISLMKNNTYTGFLIDKKLKKKIQLKNRKEKKGIYLLWLFEQISFLIVIAFSILFPIYCVQSGYLVSTNMRTGELSYFLVSMETSVITGMGLTFVLLISVLRKRIESSSIGDRVDETFEIFSNKLFYSFRIKYQTPEHKRIIVLVDLNNINKLNYNNENFELIINGNMFEDTIDISNMNTSLKVNAFDMENMELKIYDYFKPSVFDYIKLNMIKDGIPNE